jgi:hypothetical protein
MMKRVATCVLWFACGACVAQKPAGAVSVQGDCNGSASGSNITVTVNCDPSISKEQAKVLAKQYAEILRKIQEDHLSYDVVIEKLDSIQKGVDELKATTAPRHLTPFQIQTLRARMVGVTRPGEVLSYSMNDPEAVAYMRDFNDALGLQEPNLEPVAILVPGIGVHFFIASRYLTPVSAGQSAISQAIPAECMVLKIFLEGEHIPFEAHVAEEARLPGSPPTPPCALSIGAKPQ